MAVDRCMDTGAPAKACLIKLKHQSLQASMQAAPVSLEINRLLW